MCVYFPLRIEKSVSIINPTPILPRALYTPIEYRVECYTDFFSTERGAK